MADPLQNAQFLQSLFAPVSNAIAAPSEANLGIEKLRYGQRLEAIKRQQKLSDAQELYDQQAALSNLTIAGQMAIAKETTDRQAAIEDSRDKRARELALKDTISKAAAAYGDALGTEKPDPGLKDSELLNWYMSRIGPQRQNRLDQESFTKAENLARAFGLKLDIPEGASWAEKLDIANRAIADMNFSSDAGQALQLYNASKRYDAVTKAISTITPEDSERAIAAAVGSLTGKAAEKAKEGGKDFIEGISRNPSSAQTFLASYPGAYREFIAGYNQSLEDAVNVRRKSMANELDNATALFTTASKWASKPNVATHLGRIEQIAAQGGDPNSIFGGVGREAQVNLGGDSTRTVGPSASTRAPASGSEILNTVANGFVRPGRGGTAQGGQLSGDDFLAGAGLSVPNQQQSLREPAGAAGSITAPGVAEPVLGDAAINQLIGTPMPETAQNTVPRRVDTVADTLRAAGQGIGRALSPSNWAAAANVPYYTPGKDVLIKDLSSRYAAMGDKTSPRAIEILRNIVALNGSLPLGTRGAADYLNPPGDPRADLDQGLSTGAPFSTVYTGDLDRRLTPGAPTPVVSTGGGPLPDYPRGVPDWLSAYGPIKTVRTGANAPAEIPSDLDELLIRNAGMPYVRTRPSDLDAGLTPNAGMPYVSTRQPIIPSAPTADDIDAAILSERSQLGGRGYREQMTTAESKTLNKLIKQLSKVDLDSEEADILKQQIGALVPKGRSRAGNPISNLISDEDLTRMILELNTQSKR